MHQIQVQIKAARGLRDATRFNGKTNFYVKVYVGEKKEKSFALMDSGSVINSPVDTVLINIPTEELRSLIESGSEAKVSARNKCKVSFFRTIIGDVSINIADFNEVFLEQWFPLKWGNENAGELLLNLSINPPLEMGEMPQQPIISNDPSATNSNPDVQQPISQNSMAMKDQQQQQQQQQPQGPPSTNPELQYQQQPQQLQQQQQQVVPPAMNPELQQNQQQQQSMSGYQQQPQQQQAGPPAMNPELRQNKQQQQQQQQEAPPAMNPELQQQHHHQQQQQNHQQQNHQPQQQQQQQQQQYYPQQQQQQQQQYYPQQQQQQQQQPMGMGMGMAGNPMGMGGMGTNQVGHDAMGQMAAQAMAMHGQRMGGMFGGQQQQQAGFGALGGLGGMMEAMFGGGSQADFQKNTMAMTESILGAGGLSLSDLTVVEYPDGPIPVKSHEHMIIKPRISINFRCSECGMDERSFKFHNNNKRFYRYECVERCGYTLCGQCMLEITGTAPPPGAPTITYN